jgi:lipoate-protein ligase A
MDIEVLPRLIRVGRDSITEQGIRSAEKAVSPLSWFTPLSCSEIERDLEGYFEREFEARVTALTEDELTSAERLVNSKYATAAWINRLP